MWRRSTSNRLSPFLRIIVSPGRIFDLLKPLLHPLNDNLCLHAARAFVEYKFSCARFSLKLLCCIFGRLAKYGDLLTHACQACAFNYFSPQPANTYEQIDPKLERFSSGLAVKCCCTRAKL